jgi:hypothetical protein
VRITEELLQWESSGSGCRKSILMAVGIRCADHATPPIPKSWHQLRRHAAVARSVYFARRLKPRSLVCPLVFFRMPDNGRSPKPINSENPSWKTEPFSRPRNFPKIHLRVHNSLILIIVPSPLNPAHNLAHHSFNETYNHWLYDLF